MIRINYFLSNCFDEESKVIKVFLVQPIQICLQNDGKIKLMTSTIIMHWNNLYTKIKIELDVFSNSIFLRKHRTLYYFHNGDEFIVACTFSCLLVLCNTDNTCLKSPSSTTTFFLNDLSEFRISFIFLFHA